MTRQDKHAAKTVYLVEKHAEIADSMRAMLESAGLSVEVYSSPGAFGDAFDARHSGCLVLDIDPSSVNGLDIFDEICAHGIILPTILITWSNDVTIRNRAKLASVLAFLEKPISDALLLDAIERAFSQN